MEKLKPARTCQLLDLLWMEDPAFREFIIRNGGLSWVRRQPVECHHIIGGTSRRNLSANLIDVASPIHNPFGHGDPPAFMVACLYRQKQLGKLSWDVMDECIGGRPGRCKGLIGSKPLSGVYEKWRQELLA